ncbi:MAG: hypothetical protein IJ276_02750 [Alphaproteobacteria bacterium]|nr:hypothetical protein [Alphaproteobacteria bacterium]
MLSKNDRWYFYAMCLCTVLLGIFYKFDIAAGLYSNLITFISILMGFQITSFSMVFVSPVVKKLYNVKDNENGYITLKHRLKNYYKFAFNVALVSIITIFVLDIFNPHQIATRWFIINLSWVKRGAVFSIIASNIFANYKTMNFLYKIFIKDND